jgi:hypothetical protein
MTLRWSIRRNASRLDSASQMIHRHDTRRDDRRTAKPYRSVAVHYQSGRQKVTGVIVLALPHAAKPPASPGDGRCATLRAIG